MGISIIIQQLETIEHYKRILKESAEFTNQLMSDLESRKCSLIEFEKFVHQQRDNVLRDREAVKKQELYLEWLHKERREELE